MNHEFWCWDAEKELHDQGSWVVADYGDEAAEMYAKNTIWGCDGEPDQYRVAVKSPDGKVRFYCVTTRRTVSFYACEVKPGDEGPRAEVGT